MSLSEKTIFNDDQLFDAFVDKMIQGWGKSIPSNQPITMKDFRDWVKKLNSALEASADDYFRRLDIIKKNLEVLKNEGM